MMGYYASLIHSSKGLKITDFGLFPWENPKDYEPKFGPVDKEAFDRLSAWQFPSDN